MRLPCLARDPGTSRSCLSALMDPRRLITLGCLSMAPIPRQTDRGFNGSHSAGARLVAVLRFPSTLVVGSEPLLFALEGRDPAQLFDDHRSQ